MLCDYFLPIEKRVASTVARGEVSIVDRRGASTVAYLARREGSTGAYSRRDNVLQSRKDASTGAHSIFNTLAGCSIKHVSTVLR